MTSDAISEMSVPQACTLSTVEQPQRLAEFDHLYATALLSHQRLAPTRLRLVLDPDAEERARDLTTRESACCSFFTFTFSRHTDGLYLDVQVPYGHIDVLDAVAVRVGAIGSSGGVAGKPLVTQDRPSSVTAKAS